MPVARCLDKWPAFGSSGRFADPGFDVIIPVVAPVGVDPQLASGSQFVHHRGMQQRQPRSGRYWRSELAQAGVGAAGVAHVAAELAQHGRVAGKTDVRRPRRGGAPVPGGFGGPP